MVLAGFHAAPKRVEHAGNYQDCGKEADNRARCKPAGAAACCVRECRFCIELPQHVHGEYHYKGQRRKIMIYKGGAGINAHARNLRQSR